MNYYVHYKKKPMGDETLLKQNAFDKSTIFAPSKKYNI